MALYAELDSENYVLRVVVIDDAHCTTEEDGIAWCVSFFGGGIWKQTWLDGSQRGNYAYVSGSQSFHSLVLVPVPKQSFVLATSYQFLQSPQD